MCMNDLSDSSSVQAPTPTPREDPVASVSSGAKEIEPVVPPRDELRDATGHELPIAKEIQSAGVKIHPTTIPIPQNVSHMGVKPAGFNIPVQTGTAVVLPLTDDQIALGLHQSITSSWRWFAEWCVRQYKQLHFAVKTVGGKLVRTKVSH
jgi:hypothetical protein